MTSSQKILRHCFVRVFAVAAVSLLLLSARAAESEKRLFNIPPGNALATLKLFAAQSGAQLLYSADELENVTTPALTGEHTPREALERLLAGTGLTVAHDVRTGALTIQRPPRPPVSPSERRRTAASAGALRAPAAADSAPGEDGPVLMSPFVTTSTADVGYRGVSSLAGTRINTNLRDLGSSISVITQEFIEDTGATGMADLLVYATGAEVSGAYGNFTNSSFSGGRARQQPNRQNPEENTRIRGLVSAEVSRDFFITDFSFDNFNVERVDISRGPNSLLFGVGSPGGVINYSLKRPSIAKNDYAVSFRLGKRGSHREVVDFNQVLVPKRAALRVSALHEKENFHQKSAYERDRRIYASFEGVLREDRRAGLLGSTRLRANVERADVQTTPPNVIAPIDNLRDWYMLPDVAAIQAQTGQRPPARYTDGTFVPQALHDRFGTNAPFRGSEAQLLPWFITVGQVFNDPTGGEPPSVGFSAPGLGDLQGVEGRIVGSFDWIMQSNLVEETWTTGFTARTLQDTTLYDFTRNLVTGRLESRADRFDSGTATLEQLFHGGKGGLELSFNQQQLKRRSEFPFSDLRSYDIRVDNNLWLGNRQSNPNVGRSFLVSRDWGNHSVSEIERDTARGTAFYDLDLRNTFSPRWTRWLGRHVFSGIVERATREQEGRSWAMAVSSDEINMETALSGLKGNIRRQLHAGFYVGPDLRAVPNYSDVRLSGYLDVQRPVNGGTFRTFVRDPATNTIRNVTAYADEFLDNGSARKRIIETSAIAWQSYWFDNTLVGLIGERHDHVRDWLNVTVPRLRDGAFDPASLRLQPAPGLDATGSTRTWSIVGHYPSKYLVKLPSGLDFSVFVAESENFQPTGFRQDVFLRSIAPPTGKTKERGFTVSLLEDRFNVRVNWFETTNNNISLETNLAGAATNAIGGWIDRLVEARRLGVPFGFDINGQRTGLGNYHGSYDQVIATLLNMVPEPMKSARNLRLEGAAGVGLQNVIGDPVPGLASTSSFVAKGVEIELVANPTPAWTLALNVAKQETVRSGSGLELQRYYSQIRQSLVDANLWDTNIADEPNVRGDITYRQRFTRDVLNPLAAITAKDGTVSAEQRKWRFNAATSYRFSKNSRLRGFKVGGAVRWQDKAAVGYPIRLVNNEGDTVQVPDLARPYHAPATWNGDLFVAYRRRLLDRIDWTIQANFRNVLGDDELIPEVINPDGRWAVVRIPVEKAFFITNTFEF